MGLDVSFYPPHSFQAILYMRNHWWLFDKIHAHGADIFFLDHEVSDFLVDESLLDQLEEDLEEVWPGPAAHLTFAETELAWLLSEDEETIPDEIVKPLYAQVLGTLRAAVDEHGYLVCSWSA